MRFGWMVPVLVCGVAISAEPPHAHFASFNDWLGAENRGVRIGADGRLRLAPALRRVAQVPEGVIWASVPDGSGGAYLSAGNEGRLFHYTGGQVKPLTQVKGGLVFAMARLGSDLIVAPSGEGKIYRINAAGDVKPFADTEMKIVWNIAVQGSDLVLAGAGERGAMLALAREGTSRKLAELPDETAFTAMITDGQGGFYLGTHGKGLVVRYSGMGAGDRLETLMATGMEEVRGLVFHEGQIYVGANNGLAQRFAAGNLERREGYLSEPGAGTKSILVRLDRNRVPETLWQSAQSQVFAMTAWNGQLLVGTGNRGRLFAIPLDEAARALEPFSALSDLGTAQATAFLKSGQELLVVGSNPAELHSLSEAQATEGVLESRIMKGSPLADWGRAYLDAETPSGTRVEFQFRSGFTETPDATWTPWTPPLQSGERPNLNPSRFAQLRVKLSSSRGGTTPTVDGIQVHWANRNLAPVWSDVETMPPGLVITRQGSLEDIGVERVPLETQKLIPAIGLAGGEKRSFRRGSQAFVFRVNDPNGDQLSYQVRLLPERGSAIELEKAWRERFFTFDTLPVPDGKYRLEVVASDAPSQPFNGSLSAVWRTAPFLVDHTPPAISDLTAIPEGDGLRIRFNAKDDTSLIKEATLSADGDDWLQIAPEDRVFDRREEHFDLLVPRDRIKGDRVLVRVVDASNNEQSASVTIGAVVRKK
ncbi:MAG: hypothetical protein H6Q00_807 [Holophagaceae bacterium]|nr:hypothetical protein [Holophagaceae bacterium]